MGRRDPVSYQ